MKKLLLSICLGVFASSLLTGTASAHSQFMKALKAKYDFRTVSCYTCHAKGEDPKTGERYGKEVRNEFGELFVAELKEKKIAERVLQLKETEDEAKEEEIEEAITKDFLDALQKVEAMKAENGKTFGELIKAGEIEGIKLRD